MEYLIYFKSYQEEDIVNVLFFRRQDECINIYINNDLKLSTNREHLHKLLQQYNGQQFNGVDFMHRELTNILISDTSNISLTNIVRAFAVTYNYLIYTDNSLFGKQIFIDHIRNTFNSFCFHNSLIDWTGELGTQPVMYYLKNSVPEDDILQMENLYKIGLLCKAEVRVGDFVSQNYFVPFQIPNIPNFLLFSMRRTWNNIIKDMNNELSKINKGNNHVDN